MCLLWQLYWGLLLLPVIGYGRAWYGHFVFEKNKPATFGYPFYSFISDWVIYFGWLASGGRRILAGKKNGG